MPRPLPAVLLVLGTLAGAGRLAADDPSPARGWKGAVDPPAEKFAWPNGPLADIPLTRTTSPVAIFSDPGGRYLLFGRSVYDLQFKRRLGDLPEKPAVHMTAISPDGTRVVGWKQLDFRSNDKECVYVFDVEAETVLREFEMVLHARQKLGALAGPAAGGTLRTFPESENGSRVIGFLDADRLLVTAAKPEGALRVVSVATGQVTAEFRLPPPLRWRFDPGTMYALSPGRRYVAVWDGPTVRVFRTDTGAAVGELPLFVPPSIKEGMPARLAGLAFSPDGTALAATMAFGQHANDHRPRDARAYAWDLRTGREAVYAQVSGFTGDTSPRAGLQWAADGSAWLIEDALMVEVKTGKTVWRLPPHSSGTRLRSPVSIDRVWEIDLPAGGHRARMLTLPADRLAAALAAVRAGGEAVDAGFPPATAVPDARFGPKAPKAEKWVAAVDPAPPGPALGKPVELPDRPAETLESLRVAGGPRGGGALLEWVRGGRRATEDAAAARLLERIDPTTGRAAGTIEVPGGCRVVHAGPDAELAVTVDTESGSRLDVWSVADGKHVAGWRPYGAFPPAEQRVTFAAAPVADRVVTVNPAGQVVVWTLPTMTIVAAAACPGFHRPVLTPGNRYVLGMTSTGIRAIDTRTGAEAGELPYPDPRTQAPWPGAADIGPCLAVRSDGKEAAFLTLSTKETALRWDLATGTPAGKTAGVPLGGVYGLNDLNWPTRYVGPDHLLLAGRYLVDLARAEIPWQYYIGGRFARQVPDDRVWFAGPNKGGRWALAARVLPGEHEVTAVQAATEAPLLRRGARLMVKTELTGEHAEIGREVVRTATGKLVADRGWELVTEKADLTLTFTGKAEPYQRGPLMLTCQTSVSVDGKVVWLSLGVSLPGDPPAGKSLTDPGVRDHVVAGLAASLGRTLAATGQTAYLDLPSRVGRTPAGPVAVPGMTELSADGAKALTSRRLGAAPARSDR